MKKLTRQFALAALVASAISVIPCAARAANYPDASSVQVTYHGSPLLQNVKVITLFWGQGWDGSPLRDHVNNFFQALFADGRYMANLSQYSAGGYTIGNGQFLATATDSTALGKQVTDAQIQHEIGSEIHAGALPGAQTDYLYVVCTPPNVTVVDRTGKTSAKDFLAYHDFAADNQGDWAAYAVVPAGDDQTIKALQNNVGIGSLADEMTQAASHEMAEAVTDPMWTRYEAGWFDDNTGDEIGDIPLNLAASGQIQIQDVFDTFTGADGTQYLVQKIWSQQDGAPVAFAVNTVTAP